MTVILENKNISVVSHIFIDGPTQALVRYLNETKKVNKVSFIGHPLLPRPNENNSSFIQLFKRGKIVLEEKRNNLGTRFGFYYLSNIFLTINWLVKEVDSDIFIGVNNLNTVCGIFLKIIKKTNKVIYYVVDFTPIRFDNKIVNYIYHLIDRVAVTYADEIWNLSPRMNEARLKYKKLNVNLKKSKIVPMGIWLDKIKRPKLCDIDLNTMVFIGHLIKKQGLQIVIRSINLIKKQIPKINLLIIGSGEYENELKKLVITEKIKKHVNFFGFLESFEKREYLISKCACGIALYQKGDYERNFTYYADPGKLKDYLGAGLPIILTDVPHNAYELQNAGCAVVVDYDENEIANAVIKIMRDKKKLKIYKQNAINYSKQFDWIKIFEKAFSPLNNDNKKLI